MPRTKNNDEKEIAAAIKIIRTLKNIPEYRDNKVFLRTLAEQEEALKEELVQICLPPDGGTKKK